MAKAPVTRPSSPTAVSNVAEMSDEFVKFSRNQYIYKAEDHAAVPLIGYLVGLETLDSDKFDTWTALKILTTAPTQANNDEKETVDVAPGSIVYVAANTKLRDLAIYATGRYAASGKVKKVHIQPNGKTIETKKGTMKLFEVGVSKQDHERLALIEQYGDIAFLNEADFRPAELEASVSE